MKGLILAIVVLALFYNVNSMSLKSIQKRAICSNNRCNNGCDGSSCNTCNNNNVCCNSANCNSCVNQCSNNCQTTTCRNNCVTGCSSSCGQSSCSSCSQCVNKCSNDCSNDNCVNQCTQSCCNPTPVERNDSIIFIPSSEASKVLVNNSNVNLVNLTTNINIDNVIHNINNISIPVYVNTTNINNINLSEHRESIETHGNGSSSLTEYIPFPVPQPFPFPIQAPSDGCCTVLHPRRCYTDDEGQDRCYIRRSRECSDSCTSPVVTIEETESGRSGCQRVRTWPYSYCGNYVRRDCNQCYTCGGGYNPSECFRQSGCSDTCRTAAPSCIRDEYGLKCF